MRTCLGSVFVIHSCNEVDKENQALISTAIVPEIEQLLQKRRAAQPQLRLIRNRPSNHDFAQELFWFYKAERIPFR